MKTLKFLSGIALSVAIAAVACFIENLLPIHLIGGAVISVGATVFFPEGLNLGAFTQLKFYLAAGISAVMAVLAFKKVHPIIIICISAVLGIAFGYMGLL